MNILTDEEINKIAREHEETIAYGHYDLETAMAIVRADHDQEGIIQFARAIEKAVVEKLKAMLHEKCDRVDVGVLDHYDIEKFFEKIEEGE